MTTVAQIIAAKRSVQVHTISPDASVFEAVKLMAEKDIGALVVTESDAVVGVISERDYARKIALLSRSSTDTRVRDVMTSPVVTVRPAQSNEECMALMTEKRVRHLPVVDKGRLVGIVSIGDLVKDIIAEQQFTIKQLEQYIAGERAT